MGVCVKNKLAIVTGGANGIGNMIVRHLLLKGAKTVAILDVDAEAVNKTRKQFNTEFGQNRIVSFLSNVSDADQFKSSFNEAVEALGGLDIMVNNAGIVNESNSSLMIDINIKAVVQGSLMAIDVMGKHKNGKGGTIINMGSIVSCCPAKYLSIYAATKHAVLGLTRSLALNFEATGVALKVMCPGMTDTNLARNRLNKNLDFINEEETMAILLKIQRQRPEIIATEVVRLIEEASNGAIWMNTVETSTMSLHIPEFTTWGTPV